VRAPNDGLIPSDPGELVEAAIRGCSRVFAGARVSQSFHGPDKSAKQLVEKPFRSTLTLLHQQRDWGTLSPAWRNSSLGTVGQTSLAVLPCCSPSERLTA
jgi:hypothetical protein